MRYQPLSFVLLLVFAAACVEESEGYGVDENIDIGDVEEDSSESEASTQALNAYLTEMDDGFELLDPKEDADEDLVALRIQSYGVYSPFSGKQGGQAQYCDGSTHSTVWAGTPTDLLTGGNTAAYFNGTSGIKSIRVTHYNNTCSSAPAGGDYIRRAIRVDMYCGSNARGYIGTVYYGHLANRIAEGVYNNPSHLQIGSTGNWWGEYGSCYIANNYQHLHVETNNGTIYPRSCWANISQSTAIYRWSGTCYEPY